MHSKNQKCITGPILISQAVDKEVRLQVTLRWWPSEAQLVKHPLLWRRLCCYISARALVGSARRGTLSRLPRDVVLIIGRYVCETRTESGWQRNFEDFL
jgi:hypothetical protein